MASFLGVGAFICGPFWVSGTVVEHRQTKGPILIASTCTWVLEMMVGLGTRARIRDS